MYTTGLIKYIAAEDLDGQAVVLGEAEDGAVAQPVSSTAAQHRSRWHQLGCDTRGLSWWLAVVANVLVMDLPFWWVLVSSDGH
jgi:hypothetical protein